MSSSGKPDIVRRLFGAYRSRDRQVAEALLADASARGLQQTGRCS